MFLLKQQQLFFIKFEHFCCQHKLTFAHSFGYVQALQIVYVPKHTLLVIYDIQLFMAQFMLFFLLLLLCFIRTVYFPQTCDDCVVTL